MDALRQALPAARLSTRPDEQMLYVEFYVTPFTENPAPAGTSTTIGAINAASPLYAAVAAYYDQYPYTESSYKEWEPTGSESGVRRDDTIITRRPYAQATIRTPDVSALLIGESSYPIASPQGYGGAQVYERVYRPRMPPNVPVVEVRLTRSSRPASTTGGRGGTTGGRGGPPIVTHAFSLRVVDPRDPEDLSDASPAWGSLLELIRLVYGTPYLYTKRMYDRIIGALGTIISRDDEKSIYTGSYLTINHFIQSPQSLMRAAVAKVPISGSNGGGDGSLGRGMFVLYVNSAKDGNREVWLYGRHGSSPSLAYLGLDRPTVGITTSSSTGSGSVSLFLVTLSSSVDVQHVIHIFDVLAINGIDVRSNPHQRRIQAAKSYLAQYPLPTKPTLLDAAREVYRIHVAQFHQLRLAADAKTTLPDDSELPEMKVVQYFYKTLGTLLPADCEQLILVRQDAAWGTSSAPLIWRNASDMTTLLALMVPKRRYSPTDTSGTYTGDDLDLPRGPEDYMPYSRDRGVILRYQEKDLAILASRDLRTREYSYYGYARADTEGSAVISGNANVVEATWSTKNEAFIVRAERPDRAYGDSTGIVSGVIDATTWRAKPRSMRGESNDLLVQTIAYTRTVLIEHAAAHVVHEGGNGSLIVVGPVNRDILDTIARYSIQRTVFMIMTDDTASLATIDDAAREMGGGIGAPTFVQYATIDSYREDDVLPIIGTPWLVVSLDRIAFNSTKILNRIRDDYLMATRGEVSRQSLVLFSLPPHIEETVAPLLHSGARVWALVLDLEAFERADELYDQGEYTSLLNMPGVEYEELVGAAQITIPGIETESHLRVRDIFSTPSSAIPLGTKTLIGGDYRTLADAVLVYGLPDGVLGGVLVSPSIDATKSESEPPISLPSLITPISSSSHTIPTREDMLAVPNEGINILPPPNGVQQSDWAWMRLVGPHYPYGGFYDAVLSAFYPPYAVAQHQHEKALIVQQLIASLSTYLDMDSIVSPYNNLNALSSILRIEIVLVDDLTYDTTHPQMTNPPIKTIYLLSKDEGHEYDLLLLRVTRDGREYYRTLWNPSDSIGMHHNLANIAHYNTYRIEVTKGSHQRRKWKTSPLRGDTEEEDVAKVTDWDSPGIQHQLDVVRDDGGPIAADCLTIFADSVSNLQAGLSQALGDAYTEGALIIVASHQISPQYLASLLYVLSALFGHIVVYTPTPSPRTSKNPIYVLLIEPIPDIPDDVRSNIMALFPDDDENTDPVLALIAPTPMRNDKTFARTIREAGLGQGL